VFVVIRIGEFVTVTPKDPVAPEGPPIVRHTPRRLIWLGPGFMASTVASTLAPESCVHIEQALSNSTHSPTLSSPFAVTIMMSELDPSTGLRFEHRASDWVIALELESLAHH
jgi:hypothetical protein